MKEVVRDEPHGVVVQHTPLGWGVFAAVAYSIQEIVGEVEGDIQNDPDYGSDSLRRSRP